MIVDYDLDGIKLPCELFWTDEYDWSPQREINEPSVIGTRIIQRSRTNSGRPITLANPGVNNVPRSLVDQLQALEDDADTGVMTLTMSDGTTTYQVRFRRDENGRAFRAIPIMTVVPKQATDWYTIEVRLITV